MSVDISSPEIYTVRERIHARDDPTTWFLLHYDPNSTSPALSILASGQDPAIPQIREELGKCDDIVVFGYAEIGGKGLVVCYLKDSIGGVKRARAVVHSRAVASLFPDYAALVTIAHASQLTEDLVVDKLGLHAPPYQHPPTQSQTHHIQQQSNQQRPSIPIKDQPLTGPLAVRSPSPDHQRQLSSPPPSAGSRREFAVHGEAPSLKSNTSVHSDHSTSARDTSQRPPVREVTHEELGLGTPTKFDRQNHNIMSTPSGQPGPLPLAPPVSIDSQPHPQHHVQFSPQKGSPRIVSAPQQSHQLEMKGISSSDYFPDSGRSRKTSLSSRLGQLASFGKSKNNSYNGSLPNSPSSPQTTFGEGPVSPVLEAKTKSPGSPTINRFKNSSLIKNFGRRSSGGGTPSSPTSPNVRQSPPPVPPKDDEVREYAYETPSISSGPTPGHSTTNFVRNPSYTRQEVHDHQGNNRGLGIGEIARSPSAQQALFDVSQKSVKNESEIQERFRRMLDEERARAPHSIASGNEDGNGHADVDEVDGARGGGENWGHAETDDDDDEDIGLPYDRPDPDSPQRPQQNSSQQSSNIPQHDPAMPSIGETSYQGSRLAPALGGIIETQPHQGLQRDTAGNEDVAERIAELDLAEDGMAGGTGVEMSIQAERHVEEQKQAREAEDAGQERQAQAEEDRSRAEEEERSRFEEQERLRSEQEERTRLEEERIKAEEEETIRLEEEDKARREAEKKQWEEERRRYAQEQERARLEEEERLKKEEEDRQREIQIEAEKLKAEEQERKRQHEETIRREEEIRLREAEEEEARRKEEEVKRKEGIKSGFLGAKQTGGQVLTGHITVQTTRSTIWRRRWFALFPDRMDLYKNEGDSKPIQIIRLEQGTKVSQSYEESQVQGSFKITQGGDGEEFFLFTDGSEEKEMVLAALDVVLGA